jgi:hypothetical protein
MQPALKAIRRSIFGNAFFVCIVLAFALPLWGQEEDSRRKVLVMDLENKGVPPDELEIINGLVAYQFSLDPSLETMSGADVRQLVALEADRQTMGCTADSSCLAEIAGAMGAEWVVFGHVGKLGNLILLNLNLFDSMKAKAVARSSLQVKSMDEMPSTLETAVAQLLADAKVALGEKAPSDGAKAAAPSDETSASVDGPGEDTSPKAEPEPIAESVPPAEEVSSETGIMTYVAWGVGGVGGFTMVAGAIGAAAVYGLAFAHVSSDRVNPKATRALWFGQNDSGVGLAAVGVYGNLTLAAAGGALAAAGLGVALFAGGEE